MGNDDVYIALLVFGLAAFIFWVIALFNAPFLTLVITFGAILFAGLFASSGRGDGREG